MKKIIFVFALLAMFTQIASAQLTKKGGSMVMEKKESMSLGTNTGMVMSFQDVDDKLVGKLWEDFLKDRYGVKPGWDRKQKEWFADNANIPAIGGATPVDVHAATDGKKGNINFTVWFNMGNTFLNSSDYPEQYAEAEKMMEQFMVEVKKAQTGMELEDQEKELKKLEKELEKLQSANERYNKDIEKAEEAIKKAKDSIVENEKEQELTRQRIETQKEVVKNVDEKLKKIN